MSPVEMSVVIPPIIFLIGRAPLALKFTEPAPVFAVFYGVVLLGEVVTPWMVGCGLVILLGTSLSTGIIGSRRP